MQRGKMGKKKTDQPDPKWRHSAEALEKGKVNYNCKFWGSTPVSASKGSELIKESIKKLQFANDIKKSEEGLKASKLKKVELCVSTQNLILMDVKTKTTLYSFALQRVSYCADDKTSKKLFGFIARDKESSQHQCYILECEKNAEELTMSVGQAFELAYKRYKANQTESGKDVSQMKQRVVSTEKENEMLRKRLEELERKQEQVSNAPPPLASVAAPVNQHNMQESFVQPPTEQTFDPFADSPAPGYQSSSFDIQSPAPFAADPRPLPPGVGSNPFAIPVEPAVSNHNQDDLLGVFGSEPQVSNAPVEEDIFDPLAQINGTSEEPTPQASHSSFDQPQSQQNETILAPVSRPKPATLPAGLLPPPPTKQSIKERNRNSNITSTAEQTNGAPVNPDFNTKVDVTNDSQAVQDLQNGMQNNLVLF